MKFSGFLILATVIVCVFLTIIFRDTLDGYWGLLSLVFLLVLLLEFFFVFNEKIDGSKDIALIAILGTISAAARVPFAGIPSVQPSTFIIMTAGMIFGAYAGFMVGVETALLSNFFLGQGPWTPWQMLAWGLAGVVGSALKFTKDKRYGLYIFMFVSFLYGYVYGVIMNVWYWLAFIYPHTLQSFLMVWSLSVYFDTLHAIGNVIFVDLFWLKLVKLFFRYKVRFFQDFGKHLSTLKLFCQK